MSYEDDNSLVRNDPVDQSITSKKDILEDEIEEDKIDMSFRSYAILTFWIVPLFFISLIPTIPGAILILPLFGLFVDFTKNPVSKFFRSILYYLVIFTFGVNLSRKEGKFVRYWWFFTIGYVLGGLATLVLVYTMAFIIPLLLILFNRKNFLKLMLFLSFSPKSSLVWFESKEERELNRLKYEDLSAEDREYLIFKKPKFSTNIVAGLLILLSPLMLAFLIYPVGYFTTFNTNTVEKIFSFGLTYGWFGLVAIIPYLILNIPIRGKKLSTFITSKVATTITRTVATTGLNSIPYFSGEYFLEAESDIIEMQSSNGIFVIFKKGRLLSIILTPLAMISLLLRYTIVNVNEQVLQNNTLTPLEFIQEFDRLMRSTPYVLLLIMFIFPVVITILLPLIWSINDAEIKRTSWKNLDSSLPNEIKSIEDLGSSLDKIFKIVIGISAITNLSSAISLIVGKSNVTTAWMVTLIVLILSAVLVLPGVITMAYLYFGLGDHVNGVNYIRYHLSHENNISVGTISKEYSKNRVLSDPPIEMQAKYKIVKKEIYELPLDQ